MDTFVQGRFFQLGFCMLQYKFKYLQSGLAPPFCVSDIIQERRYLTQRTFVEYR